MTDAECAQIIGLAMGHLIRCAFDDFSLFCLDMGVAITDNLTEALKEAYGL